MKTLTVIVSFLLFFAAAQAQTTTNTGQSPATTVTTDKSMHDHDMKACGTSCSGKKCSKHDEKACMTKCEADKASAESMSATHDNAGAAAMSGKKGKKAKSCCAGKGQSCCKMGDAENGGKGTPEQ